MTDALFLKRKPEKRRARLGLKKKLPAGAQELYALMARIYLFGGELLQHFRNVTDTPMFCILPVFQTDDVDYLNAHFFMRWRNAHKPTGMGAV